MTVKYLHFPPTSNLPNCSNLKPFRAIIVIESNVTKEWQELLSMWLVKSGCFYMMAWGKKSSTWNDSVDLANIIEAKFEDISDEKFIMTTWHEKETLKDVFKFSKNCAFHDAVRIKNTIVVHISNKSREKEILAEYADA